MAHSHDNRVLILTGAPGAGKTTVSRILADCFGRAVHLESDRFFDSIRSGYIEPWKHEAHGQNEVVMRIVGDAAAAFASAGYFTIVDGIVLPRWYLEPLRGRLRSAGHTVAYAVLVAPLDICAARAGGREAQPLGDIEVTERLWHEFANLGSLENHAIQVATEPPERAAQLVLEALADGLLDL